jgi:hypothetical protein
MDNFIWTCQNQGMLQKIYKEKKHQIYLQKNRAEKQRARIKNNIPSEKWKCP